MSLGKAVLPSTLLLLSSLVVQVAPVSAQSADGAAAVQSGGANPAAAPAASIPLKIALLKWYGANTTTTFAVGKQPRGVCFDGANIWVANYGSNTVTKLRTNDGQVLGTYAVGTQPANVAFDGANIWVTNYGSGNVTELRASDGKVLGTFSVGGQPFGLAFDGTNIWVGNAVGSAIVTKVRPSDGKILGTFPVSSVGYGVAFDGNYVWTTNSLGTVTRLKLDGTNAGVFNVGQAPWGLAFDGANIWVADHTNGQGSATKLRASDGAVLATTIVGGVSPYGVVYDGTSVFVTTNQYVAQLRLSDGAVLRTFNTPNGSAGIAFDGASLWVAGYDGNSISKM